MLRSLRPPAFQINRVWAKNFRSISDASTDLDRLTVFVGPNASGKSNLLDILRFIKDALRFDLEAAISMRHGLGAIHHQETQEELADIEIGIVASVRSLHLDSLLPVEYDFHLTSAGDGKYKVRREYGRIGTSDEGSEPIEFIIENGNLVGPESLLQKSPQKTLFGEAETGDFDIGDFDTTNLAFPTLFRTMGRLSPHGPKEYEATIQLMHSTLMRLYRNLLNMRFYHIFPNTIREPQRLGNPFPARRRCKKSCFRPEGHGKGASRTHEPS